MNECQLCEELFDDSDTYEYRGFMFCQEHFDEGIKRVDEKRDFVMEVTNASTLSQRNGEFKNNPKKHNINNVAPDGLPIIRVKEPMILQEYERGEL